MPQSTGRTSAAVAPTVRAVGATDETAVAMLAATAVGLGVAARPGAARTLRELAGGDVAKLAAARGRLDRITNVDQAVVDEAGRLLAAAAGDCRPSG